MKKTIITISREFGSGGHFIGEEVAKRMNIPYYDKDIIFQIAEKTGYSESFIQEQSEYAPSKNLFAYAFVGRDRTGSSLSDQVYAAQTQVIRDLAQKGSCVIIGRCANMILKDYSNVLRVFVYGDWDFRIREASKKLSGTTKDIEKFMQKDDKRKEDFCKRFMGVDWADMTKYNLCLDNGTLGYEKCVEEIESALEILKK